jgi:catechol 2,3-dioxygenase-like lactoylglutathione lyase family enzyme
MDGARRFYGEVLGLKEAEIPGDIEQEAMGAALFQCGGGTQLLVYQRSEPSKAEHTVAGWIVDDLDAVVDGLIAKGLSMEVYDLPGLEFDERGVGVAGDNKVAWFKDPEGNILSINETR